jgi:hypothetical protein
MPDELKNIDNDLLNLLSLMLENNIEKRIKAEEAYDHDWLYLAHLERNERCTAEEKHNKFQQDLIITHRMNVMVGCMKQLIKDFDANRFLRGHIVEVIHYNFNSVLL